MSQITDAIGEILRGMKKPRPCHVNRISQLDDNCLRRLYYYRMAWDKMPEIDDNLQGIFETGNKLEPVIERILSEVGNVANPPFRIVGQQVATRDKLLEDYQISGRIDGFWQNKRNGEWQTEAVVDIKTSNPNVFGSLNSYDDLSKYSWTRKYRGQLMLYALAHNLERCVLVFVNKSNLFDMKEIWFDLDMAYAERLLKKAETVNEAIVYENPPDKLNDPDECPRCSFNSICMPEYTTGDDLYIVTEGELEEVLTRLQELKPTSKEIADLEKRRDQLLVKGQNMACGPFVILWSKVQATKKPNAGGPYEYWKKRIIHNAIPNAKS